MSFKDPAFARLSPKIGRASREMEEALRYYSANRDALLSGDWGALAAISQGVHNIYNGMEDILLSIARDVDGEVPTGETNHQDLLDQMAAEVGGRRPPVIDQDLYENLSELKGFRHLVRHRYGIELKPRLVEENLLRMEKAFPAFVRSVESLADFMLGEEHSGGIGDGPP